jgi:hypothetical protein
VPLFEVLGNMAVLANEKEWEFKLNLLALPTGTNSLPKILMFSSFFFI